MEKALAKKSDILKVKYKFFINRIVIYFSFLLIPVWIHKTDQLGLFGQAFVLVIYIFFMAGQWYLFGKEVDHRLKIYYKANSSMERIIYRVLMGNICLLLLFNLMALFSSQTVTYLFWIFFGLLGLFYSWPTRGKIIEETMVSQFGEVRYLDSFEKTILVLSFVTFLISMPEFSLFENIDALKLYLDPDDVVSGLLWKYLSVLYLPFNGFPHLYNLVWNLHFFFVGIGIFLLCFYCFLRYFFSRRLAILGVYAVISSYSLTKIFMVDYFQAVVSTMPLIWLWAFIWSTRSGTYRSGLFTGLVGFYLTIFQPHYWLLLVIGISFVYFGGVRNKTIWFKKQWLRYNGMGWVLATILLVLNYESHFWNLGFKSDFFSLAADMASRKAFFFIAPLGLILTVLYISGVSNYVLRFASFDREKVMEALGGILILVCLGWLVSPVFLSKLSLLWVFAFFALVPLEWIFQTMSRLRSKRNIIYAIYILVCLLDSQMENRIRVVAKMFLDSESLQYIIQY